MVKVEGTESGVLPKFWTVHHGHHRCHHCHHFGWFVRNKCTDGVFKGETLVYAAVWKGFSAFVFLLLVFIF